MIYAIATCPGVALSEARPVLRSSERRRMPPWVEFGCPLLRDSKKQGNPASERDRAWAGYGRAGRSGYTLGCASPGSPQTAQDRRRLFRTEFNTLGLRARPALAPYPSGAVLIKEGAIAASTIGYSLNYGQSARWGNKLNNLSRLYAPRY